MGYLNKTMLIGNLGRKPELYNTDPNKPAFLKGSLAVDDSYTDRATNQKVKRTVWYEFIMNGKRAEAFFQYMDKGSTVYLEGEMFDDVYNSNLKPYPCYDAQGQPIMDANGAHFHAYIQVERKEKKFRVRDWKFMDGKRADNSAYAAPAAVPGVAVQPGAAAVQASFAPAPAAVVPAAAPVAPAAAPVAPAAAPTFAVQPTHLPAGV